MALHIFNLLVKLVVLVKESGEMMVGGFQFSNQVAVFGKHRLGSSLCLKRVPWYFTQPAALRLLACLALVLPLKTQAIDLLPEDAIAPPVGLHAIQFRYASNRLEGRYQNGNKVAANDKLSFDSFAVRYSTAFSLANRTSVFYVDAPYSNTRTNIQDAREPGWGFGDATFALAHWLLEDRKKEQYAGIVGYLTLPTGEYDPRYTANSLGLNANPGQNRWSAALQAGHFMRLGHGVGWLVAFDTVWFGRNDDYRPLVSSPEMQLTLERRPLYTLQTHFSRRFGQKLMLGLGYYWVTGGEVQIAGAYLNNQVNTHRYQLTTTYDLTPAYRIGAQYGGNLKTRNGFDEKEQFSLRVWRFF
jgi:hypothetical protein